MMSSSMPTQLTYLFQHPALMQYSRKLSYLFTRLPKELSPPFSSCLASTLDVVHSTLPPALISPFPKNNALSPICQIRLPELTSMLTIFLGTVFTTAKLFVHSDGISDLFSKLLTAMNTGLYGNPSLDLAALLKSLQGTMTDFHSLRSQPYSKLTNFPNELFSMLNNSPPSVLHPLPLELDNHLFHLVCDMALDLNIIVLEELIEELPDAYMTDSLVVAYYYYHLDMLTVQYVYQAREYADTEPDKCSICWDEMKDGDKVRRLRCLHDFHMDCVDRWLDDYDTCPMCRKHICGTR